MVRAPQRPGYEREVRTHIGAPQAPQTMDSYTPRGPRLRRIERRGLHPLVVLGIMAIVLFSAMELTGQGFPLFNVPPVSSH